MAKALRSAWRDTSPRPVLPRPLVRLPFSADAWRLTLYVLLALPVAWSPCRLCRWADTWLRNGCSNGTRSKRGRYPDGSGRHEQKLIRGQHPDASIPGRTGGRYGPACPVTAAGRR